MNIQCNTGSRNFAKEMRVLKMRNAVASHEKLIMTNCEPLLKLILFQLYKKLPKNLMSTILASGEGNGTPLQYSCLENPTDGEV